MSPLQTPPVREDGSRVQGEGLVYLQACCELQRSVPVYCWHVPDCWQPVGLAAQETDKLIDRKEHPLCAGEKQTCGGMRGTEAGASRGRTAVG